MDIIFYKTLSGRYPIADFINAQQKRDQGIILAVFNDIRNKGLKAIGCQFHQLEGKLWEIKVKTPFAGYRFLYVMLTNESLFILHVFKKKTKKTPRNELEIARKRLKEIL